MTRPASKGVIENGVQVRVHRNQLGQVTITATLLATHPKTAMTPTDIENLVRAVSVVLRREAYPYMDPDRTIALVQGEEDGD